ncbi:MAG: tetratricopeptide repeat protein [Candidatus Hatepunaea meridiana]|nr:tetratricopeptide repeat protein [Candidatus Hatepunaea meridiana]
MNKQSHIIAKYLLLLIVIFFTYLFTSCAYYNYFYNAKKYYEDGEKSRKEGEEEKKTRGQKNLSAYDRAIESAGRMLKYYPDSRWEDDALLLLAKAYYRTENYRKAIGKIDELTAKYPQSVLIQEGTLWKGMSLLKVSQPDSGRLIISNLFTPETENLMRAQAHFALGEYYYSQERWELSVEQFRDVLDSGVEDKWLRGDAWIKIGECLDNIGQIDEAVKIYDEILGSKPSRRTKLEASLHRAVILRQLGRTTEAFESLETLLKDAAYIKDFPRIELETAHCLREMKQFEEARERFENLIETNKRGELAAEANYELGSLLWEQWRDIATARTTLSEVKKAERASPLVPAADSLKSEAEQLFKSWQWIGFLEGQIATIDSSLKGLHEFLYTDTTYVDSLEQITQTEQKKSGKRGKSRRNSRRSFGKVGDEQVEADTTSDSTRVEIDSTTLFLDSTTLVNLYKQRFVELRKARFELAGFHLFKRNDRDSAAYYFKSLVVSRRNIPQIISRLDTIQIFSRRDTLVACDTTGRDAFAKDTTDKRVYSTKDTTDRSVYPTKDLTDMNVYPNPFAATMSDTPVVCDTTGRNAFAAKDTTDNLEVSGYPADEIWERAVASLAYIARVNGDTAKYDSLYRLILEELPDGPFALQVRVALGLSDGDEEVDSLKMKFEEAETYWLDNDSAQYAREMFMRIAEQADSLSDIRARALLAAAYLLRKELYEDSIATEIYSIVTDEFKNTPWERLAKERSRSKYEADRPGLADMDEDKKRIDKTGFYDELSPDYDNFESDYLHDDLDQPDKVYDPNDVDELPKLKTSSSMLKNYIRSNYPEEALFDDISGKVELEFVVDRNGKTTDINVLSVEPAEYRFEEAAQDVLKRLKYRPGSYHGRPVAVRIKQVFTFGSSEDK